MRKETAAPMRSLARFPAIFIALAMIVAASCGGGGESRPEPSEVLRLSALAAKNSGDYSATYEVQAEIDGSTASVSGEVGGTVESVLYWTADVRSESDVIGDPTESMFVTTDMYVLDEDGWYVRAPWSDDQWDLADTWQDPRKRYVRYREIARNLTEVVALLDEEIGGEMYWHYRGVLPWEDFPQEMLSSLLGQVFDEGEPATVDIWLEPEGYLPLRTEVEVQVGTTREATVALSFEHLSWGVEPVLPEVPADARSWRELEPIVVCGDGSYLYCKEPQAELEAESVAECRGRSVCLAPIGRVDADLVRHLVSYYAETYGLEVSVLTPSENPDYDSSREQSEANILVGGVSEWFFRSDEEATIIAITPFDLYDRYQPETAYVLGRTWWPDRRGGIVSTYRMDPQLEGQPANDDLYYSRVRKLVTNLIGVMHYGLAASGDPASPLYDGIGGPGDLDWMSEPLELAAGS